MTLLGQVQGVFQMCSHIALHLSCTVISGDVQ